MGYIIVLEGRHQSGKSTLAAQIEKVAKESDEWDEVVNIHHTRGDSTPEKLEADKKMIEDAPARRLYVFDRHYLSELVYAPIDGRTTTIGYNPLYWEQHVGQWVDQRGLRLYLTGEPLYTNESPVNQMYERLTARTNWQRVEPREFKGYQLARDVLLAVQAKRMQNETWGYPAEPIVTATNGHRYDTNYLYCVEEIAGFERELYALRKSQDSEDDRELQVAMMYSEIRKKRAELDRILLAPHRWD